MKIFNENRIHHFDNMAYKSKSVSKSTEGTAKLNRDSIFIGSSKLSQADKLIAGEAAHRVTQEVRTPTFPGKIEQLKQQVADGTYRPDAEKIAARILLEKGNAVDE